MIDTPTGEVTDTLAEDLGDTPVDPSTGLPLDAPIDTPIGTPIDTDGDTTDERAQPLVGHQALRALILTSPGVYHNYEQQTQDIGRGIVERANVRFDVSLAEPDRWRTTDFSLGYDVLIYNICMADNQDAALIANMRRQTEELGVPAVFIHCTMHSFRETDLWWPLLGLQSKAHEPLRPLRQIQDATHPILTGIPEDWVLPEDELYINLDFIGQRLLSTVGEDGEAHTTAWIAYHGLTPVFGTTLGHSEETLKNTAFHQLLANAVLFVTGNLTADGQPTPGMGPMGDGMDIFGNFSAPEGVKFLGREGKDCVYRKLAIAAAPCYLRCIVNPFEWGEETRACKAACDGDLPGPDELIQACMPTI
ncbi:MAG: ThuA domain-containing protein [Haliea sp.]|nr:ThuA domain-containing protein [Haliea sp.]